MNNEDLFLKTMKCPVCNKEFKVTKVKSKRARVEKRDSDFCAYFKGVNPYFYSVSICPNCGYAATEGKYKKIHDNQKKTILKEITLNWKKRDVNGERTIEEAINTYKLALYQATLIEEKYKYRGLLTLKLAWLYRYKEDWNSEKIFLKGTLENFERAFKEENFDISFSVGKCAYLIGETYRRLDDLDNAVKWYGTALELNKYGDMQLQKQIREQWQLISEEKRKIS